jgi:hypothetical protein
MSWKPVELQVALPRTVDHSRLQQIQQHQPELQNMMDGEEIQKESLRMQQTVTESSEEVRAELRDRQHHGAYDRGRGKRSRQPKAEDAPHPYKGHQLDIKL